MLVFIVIVFSIETGLYKKKKTFEIFAFKGSPKFKLSILIGRIFFCRFDQRCFNNLQARLNLLQASNSLTNFPQMRAKKLRATNGQYEFVILILPRT